MLYVIWVVGVLAAVMVFDRTSYCTSSLGSCDFLGID